MSLSDALRVSDSLRAAERWEGRARPSLLRLRLKEGLTHHAMLEVYKPQLATIETWGGWSTLRSVSIALGCTEVAQVLDHAPYLERIRGVMIDTFARPGRFAAVSDLAVLDVMATEAELATLRRFEKLRHFGAWLSELRTLDFCEHAQ